MDDQWGISKTNLEVFRIAGLPPDFYYIPNFISAEEESSIVQKVRFPLRSYSQFFFLFSNARDCRHKVCSSTINYPALFAPSQQPMEQSTHLNIFTTLPLKTIIMQLTSLDSSSEMDTPHSSASPGSALHPH